MYAVSISIRELEDHGTLWLLASWLRNTVSATDCWLGDASTACQLSLGMAQSKSAGNFVTHCHACSFHEGGLKTFFLDYTVLAISYGTNIHCAYIAVGELRWERRIRCRRTILILIVVHMYPRRCGTVARGEAAGHAAKPRPCESAAYNLVLVLLVSSVNCIVYLVFLF